MWSKKLGFVFLLASFALFSALPVFASTITVTSTSDSGSGTLRAAIAAAAPGDTINFNLAYPATITVASPLLIATTLTINGPGAANLAVSGGNAVGVFQITAGTVSISGLTIVDGYTNDFVHDGVEGNGGGIYNSGTTTVTNATFSNDQAVLGGGGIYNSGTLTVTKCTLTGDSGGLLGGGGIYNSGTATLSDTTMTENYAGIGGGGIYNTKSGTVSLTNVILTNDGTNSGGGGIYNAGGTVTITNSNLSEDTANNGGAIVNDQGTVTIIGSTFANSEFINSTGGAIDSVGTLTVTDSTFTGNKGGDGGAIYSNGTLTVTNSTISGNYAAYAGGGIDSLGTLVITNSTIANNSSYSPGAGIDGNNLITIKNTIVAVNTFGELGATPGGNCAFTGSVTSDGHNLSDDTSCLDFFTGVGDLNNTPSGLDPAGLKNNGGPTQTIALLSGPAIYDIPLSPVNYCTLTDGVTPVATDQRGVTRPQSPQGCSIGAFEPQAPSVYAQLQALYSAVENQIAALPPTDKADCDKDDRRQLHDAADELSEMLDAKNWSGTDGDHLVADRSFRFFEDDRQATEDLTRILHDRDDHKESTLIPSQEIQADLASLAAANRLLATTAIAGASTKHPDLIVRAKDKLADGDAALAGGNYERAIDDYQRAWSLAEDVR